MGTVQRSELQDEDPVYCSFPCCFGHFRTCPPGCCWLPLCCCPSAGLLRSMPQRWSTNCPSSPECGYPGRNSRIPCRYRFFPHECTRCSSPPQNVSCAERYAPTY